VEHPVKLIQEQAEKEHQAQLIQEHQAQLIQEHPVQHPGTAEQLIQEGTSGV
jgi:hypothetical protein